MKKIITATLVFSAIGGCVYLSSCKTKKAAPATTTAATPAPTAPSVTYTSDIKPILDANCANSCHSAEEHAHNVDLSTYESTKEVGGKKFFLGAINHEAGYHAMPPPPHSNGPIISDGKLAQPTIDKITAWIKAGMPK